MNYPVENHENCIKIKISFIAQNFGGSKLQKIEEEAIIK